MFVGVKMLLIDVYKIPIGVSLAVVALIIGVSVWLSLRRTADQQVRRLGGPGGI
jgi:tellurite resistance protein TerC